MGQSLEDRMAYEVIVVSVKALECFVESIPAIIYASGGGYYFDIQV